MNKFKNLKIKLTIMKEFLKKFKNINTNNQNQTKFKYL